MTDKGWQSTFVHIWNIDILHVLCNFITILQLQTNILYYPSDNSKATLQIVLPVQLTMPSPVYPISHWQENDPSMLKHLAREWQTEGDSLHSLMSTE
jgi:hypothetical protein